MTMVHARPDATEFVAVGGWATKLGSKHGARERNELLTARTARDNAAEVVNASLERWTLVVAAMAQLVKVYNEAYDRDVLSVVEDRTARDGPMVTIQAGEEGGPSLLATLEGTLICVRMVDREGLARETELPLRRDRDDDETAAYILRNWMERL